MRKIYLDNSCEKLFPNEKMGRTQSFVNHAKRSEKCLARHDITISAMLKLLHIFNILGVL